MQRHLNLPGFPFHPHEGSAQQPLCSLVQTPGFRGQREKRLGQPLYDGWLIGFVALSIEAPANFFFDTGPITRVLISRVKIFLCQLLVLTALRVLQTGRTLLNTIIGHSEVILEDQKDEVPVNLQDLEPIRCSGQHLLSLISHVLDLAKIEGNQMAIHLQPLRLESLLAEIGEIIFLMMRRQENYFGVENLAGDLIPVADPLIVRPILLNKLSNGATSTENGRIWLKINYDYTNARPPVMFHLADTGVGIVEAEIARRLMPFEPAEHRFAHLVKGTGLGLAIANLFCQLVGGSIFVTREKGVVRPSWSPCPSSPKPSHRRRPLPFSGFHLIAPAPAPDQKSTSWPSPAASALARAMPAAMTS